MESLGVAASPGIDWIGGHHQEPTETLSTVTGIVSDIVAVCQRYERETAERNYFVPVARDIRTTTLTEATGWESEDDGTELPGCQFTGYVVSLL